MASNAVCAGTSACVPNPFARLVHVACGICGADDPQPVALGEDFEHGGRAETYLMVRCRACGLLYLNPRPAGADAGGTELERDVAPKAARPRRLGRLRRRLEAGRFLRACGGLPARARILEVGCGDGSHLALIREFTGCRYRLEGTECDPHAVAAARAAGLTVYRGTLGETELERSSYDLVFALHALEGSGDPRSLLAELRHLLRPGGSLILETANASSVAGRVFRDRYWGGYRFPQAWQVFTPATLARLAADAGLQVTKVATRVAPLGWISSIRNVLLDARAPRWLVARFSRDARVALALFVVVDALARRAGGGSLLCATLRRPAS